MMKRYYAVICLFAFIWVASGTMVDASETLEVKTEIDKAALTTGDFLLYQVEVIHPIFIQLQPVSLNQYFKEGMDVEPLEPIISLRQSSEENQWFSRWWPFGQEETTSHQTTRWSWRLWPSQERSWTIPEISIQSIQIQKEGTDPLYQGTTEAMAFTVRSLLEGQQNPVLKINKELPDAPVLIHWIWLIIAGVVVVLLGVIFVFYHRNRSPIQTKPEELPHERALRRLRELEQFLLAHPQEVHQYYFLLSEFFREYLENQFNFPATSMTTQEFLPMLAGETSYTVEERNRIVLLTQKSDLIKYAEALPTQTEMNEAYREVVALVEKVAYTVEEETETSSTDRELQEVS